jgi:pyridoxamine 5'-phosphate oxidase
MAHFAKRTTLSLEALRADYRLAELSETHCRTNPIEQFQAWFQEAQAADLKEPNAMALATATPAGKPSGRIVLLKEAGEFGFVFYTNYHSRKGRELEAIPQCALTFYWAELERQVRVEGQVERVPQEKSEAYFRGRPKGSRLGALASEQSTILPSREPLESRLAELEAIYRDTDDVPLPEHWGGYCVRPDTIEFWQGRTNRLHDRIRYQRKGENEWVIERLSP